MSLKLVENGIPSAEYVQGQGITNSSQRDLRYFKEALDWFDLSPKALPHWIRYSPVVFDVLKALGKRQFIFPRIQDQRRLPEYNWRITMMVLSNYWETMSGKQIEKYPAAIDATSSFVTLIYGVDDTLDGPYGLTARRSLDDLLAATNIQGYTGHRVLNDFKETVSLDMPNPGNEVILARATDYLQNFVEESEEKNKSPETPSLHEVLAYRRRISGEFGRILAGLMNSAAEIHQQKSTSIEKTFESIGLVGQLHDEWWDLIEEFGPGSKNIIYVLLQNHPDELERVRELVCRGKDIIPFGTITQAAPQTMAAFRQVHDGIVQDAEDPKVRQHLNLSYKHLLPVTKRSTHKLNRYALNPSLQKF